MKDIDIINKNHYNKFIKMLEKEEGFSFIRMGDGEWGLIFKKDPKFSVIKRRWNDSIFLDYFSTNLKKIAKKENNYYFGIQPYALRLYTNDILEIIPDNADFSNADAFHKASKSEEIYNFFNILKKRNVLVIGREYLKDLNKYFNFNHIISPDKFWNEKDLSFIDEIEYKIEKEINERDNIVILYSAGVASKLILDNMYNKYGNKITQIDTGSIFEPYIGLNIRKYHKTILEKINNKNNEK